MKIHGVASLLGLAVLMLALPAWAGYEITRSVLASGGQPLSGGDFTTTGSVGQAAIGPSAGSGYQHEAGFWFVLDLPTAAQEASGSPRRYELGQNHPNPFNPKTHIRYALPEASRVALRLYDVTGRILAVLVDAELPAGWHELDFDGSSLASGIYFYRLEAGRFTETRKLILLK